MPTSKSITGFRCLTFDCFGTLVDWNRGIWDALEPLLSKLPENSPLRQDRREVLRLANRHEMEVQRDKPSALYPQVLGEMYDGLAKELGVDTSEGERVRFGQSVADWPAFPDSLDALHRLHKTYKLVILSNVDRPSFEQTLEKQFPGLTFDAIYTAQDIGSYKPDLRNFQYLLDHCEEDLGVRKDDIIHTAQSLTHDHEPAKVIGLTSAWIERDSDVKTLEGGNLEGFEGKLDLTWRFKTLGEMADAVDAAQRNEL